MEKWKFDDHSFEYTARFIYKFNQNVAKSWGHNSWQELADYMKSETQNTFWKWQREKQGKDLTSWGTMGFTIVIQRLDYEHDTLWVQACLSASIVQNLLAF